MSQKSRRHRHEPSHHAHAGEPGVGRRRRLEVVLKADTQGTLQAVSDALSKIEVEGAELIAIDRGVGDVSKSDLAMALTGSHLVVAFDVGVMPRAEDFAKEHGVEIRLYSVIYRLTRDLEEIARSLVPAVEQETVLGQGRVIALFKSTRRGIILGCEVLQGRIALGMRLRLIASAGPIYTGTVTSLHIQEDAVKEARPGQQVGLKIPDFNRAHVGDLVECYDVARPPSRPWAPRPGVYGEGF